MELINIFLIAIALAMDAFTVSISGGAAISRVKISNAFLVGLYFGFFQFFMSFIGFKGGELLNNIINKYDHWIALGLLVFIGGKMIIESFKKSTPENFSLKHRILLILAIVTSIDALGVGLSYSLFDKPFLIPAIIIGIIAFLFSFAGMFLGKILKKVLKNKAELMGGIILISIGISIAIKHGAFVF